MPLVRLAERTPTVSAQRLVAGLVPPPQFDAVRMGTYHPDPGEPSQAEALRRCRRFVAGIPSHERSGSLLARLRLARRRSEPAMGLYLDGGFGVGKTHLLASMWHATAGPAVYGTFMEFTQLIGALGFARARDMLAETDLIAIDEFELDDPGDTMMMTRLLRELTDGGTAVAATSNTLPDRLGEGRFAAADFLREIQAMATRFDVVRIDGPDYRHREAPELPEPPDEGEVIAEAGRRCAAVEGEVALDDFDRLLEHMATVHPWKYGALLDGVESVFLTGTHPVLDQSVALRMVVLIDRLYDRDLPVMAAGGRVDELFGEELLHGGYRKKYLRALSRISSLVRRTASHPC